MKIWAPVFTICVTLIAACNPSAAHPISTATAVSPTIATHTVQPTLTPIPTRPATATIKATSIQPATATLSATVTPPPSSSQEKLKDEWRFVFNGSMVLFSSCELMYETHVRYQNGEIDEAKAKSDLAVESDFFTIIYKQFIKWLDPSQSVAPYKEDLERDMDAWIGFWEQMNSGDIGSPAITDPLFETCSSLFETQNRIITAAMDAGLTGDSADELALEIEELLNDLYNSVRGDN